MLQDNWCNKRIGTVLGGTRMTIFYDVIGNDIKVADERDVQ